MRLLLGSTNKLQPGCNYRSQVGLSKTICIDCTKIELQCQRNKNKTKINVKFVNCLSIAMDSRRMDDWNGSNWYICRHEYSIFVALSLSLCQKNPWKICLVMFICVMWWWSKSVLFSFNKMGISRLCDAMDSLLYVEKTPIFFVLGMANCEIGDYRNLR